MTRSCYVILVHVSALLLVSACGQPQQTSLLPHRTELPATVQDTEQPTQNGGATNSVALVEDQASLIEQLRSNGLSVDIVGVVEQPFLRGKGTTLRVSGGNIQQLAELQSYDYRDTDFDGNGRAAAEVDAQGISPEGNPRTTMVTWIEPPHFFRSERVLVIYIGSDPAVLELLVEVLGPQFAGR
jgi:hypothetical protein